MTEQICCYPPTCSDAIILYTTMLYRSTTTVVWDIFVVKNFSYAQLCTKIKCVKVSSPYTKYTRYYGKGSSV